MEKRLDRGAGILLPISSLPSPYGIGTFGKEAYHFVNQLWEARQSYWQVLPIGPTSYGDSPYQSFSTFAGNPYYIDLDMLVEEGLLETEDLTSVDWGALSYDVDYQKMYENRYRVLKKAFHRCGLSEKKKIAEFVEENADWIGDYALFMACKDYFDGRSWLEWEAGIRTRSPISMAYYSDFLSEKIQFWQFVQYKFNEQWRRLKRYANDKNIKIIGDIPIYVALDSADVWSNTQQYQLDEKLTPVDVAGCPPDAFSDFGQKWGNPLYRWDVMEQDGFSWWKKRIKDAAARYDIIRIDHFIGIVRYYAIPEAGLPVDGEFRKGPGLSLINALNEVLGDSKIIAEDLGILVPEVRKALKESGYPGMKVLEFAFDGNAENEYLPHCYEKNCVVYSGTHDNETLQGYFESLSKKQYEFLCSYAGVERKEDLTKAVIKLAYRSVADTAIIQMQDILEKDNHARMNLPATVGKNWKWRMKQGEFGAEEIAWLKELSKTFGRWPQKNLKQEDKKKVHSSVDKKEKQKG